MINILKKLSVISFVFFMAGCSPITSYHGFNASDRLHKAANNYQLSQEEVLYRFGPPSFLDKKDDKEKFYYLSYKKERYAFLRPEIVDRKLIALSFDGDQLESMNEYALKDGNVIAINNQETPTFGKDLNVVQEILSNVGKFNSVPGQNGTSDGSVLGRNGNGF